MSLDLQVHGPCSAFFLPGWGCWVKGQPTEGTALRPPWAFTCFWLNAVFLPTPHLSTTRQCVDSSCSPAGHTRVSEDLVGLQSPLASWPCSRVSQFCEVLHNLHFFFKQKIFLYKKLIYLYNFCCTGSSLLHGLSLVGTAGGCSSLRGTGFSLR